MRPPRRFLVAALAFGGLVGGHALAYALVAPDPHVHTSLLAETGHRYFDWLVVPAVALFVAALVAAGARRWQTSGPDRRAGRLALRLTPLQVAGFLILEAGERVLQGGSPAIILGEQAVVVGVFVQVLVALAAALLVVLVSEVAATGTASGVLSARPMGASSPLSSAPFVLRLRPATGGASLRAPPR